MRSELELSPQNIRRALLDLYAEPLSNFGADAVDRWFSEGEVEEIVEFAKRLAV